MPTSPNVLLIVTDQQQAAAMSCAGHSDLTTPNMDRLAADGVRFANAYCTFPLCTPSRATMFCGLPNHAIGVIKNGVGIPEELRSRELGTWLCAAGYDCAYGGKWHVPEMAMPGGHGFEVICGFDDLALPHRCAEFLHRARTQPFFLVAAFDNPHNICEHARDQLLPWGDVPEAPAGERPNLPLNFAPSSYEPQVVRLTADETPKINHARAYDEDRWRLFRHVYFRLIEKVDAQLGVILAALEQSGEYDNTLILFTSDHGDMAGAHRLSQKSYLYDESAKVPLLVRPPGGSDGGIRDGLVSLGLDLFPTVCDYVGLEPPPGLPGLSLRPLIEHQHTAGWRQHVVVETEFARDAPSGGFAARMVRTQRYKYIVYDWGQHREQLFDLETDPGELLNLAVECRHQNVLNEHRELLAEWCRETGDGFARHYSHRGCAAIPGIGFAPVEEKDTHG